MSCLNSDPAAASVSVGSVPNPLAGMTHHQEQTRLGQQVMNQAVNTNVVAGLPTAKGGAANKVADSDEDMDDIPLNILQQQQNHQKTKQNGKRKEQLRDSSGSDNDDDENSDDDDDDAKDHDIDWYDAKILSYNETTRQFKVHFLGDEMDVIYDMDLVPGVVRPSVRAWTKRTLGLLCWGKKNGGGGDLLLSSSETMRKGDNATILSTLSAGTDMPEDGKRVNDILGIIDTKGKASGSNNNRLVEYKMLLKLQQYLATKISPQDDEDSDDDEGSEEDGPGPLADSMYVKHLCDCMEEAERACEWLLGESTVLDMVRNISSKDDNAMTQQEQQQQAGVAAVSSATIANKVSKEALLSFLVNGARFLNHLLPLDPNHKDANTASSKLRRGRTKKKQRLLTARNTSSSRARAIDDTAFDSMLSKALTSNESLHAVLTRLLKKAALMGITPAASAPAGASETTAVSAITSTLTRNLALLFEDVWTPFAEWTKKSMDMVNGTSKQFYSIGDVEMQLLNASSKEQSNNMALLNLSEWIDKLDAKLKRARSFEMETWSAIQACTQPVLLAETSLAPTRVAESSSKKTGGDGGSENDDCMLSLQRLKDEASMGDSMRNLNPLGRHTVDAPMGLTMPSRPHRFHWMPSLTLVPRNINRPLSSVPMH